jgi:hypothetical protein
MRRGKTKTWYCCDMVRALGGEGHGGGDRENAVNGVVAALRVGRQDDLRGRRAWEAGAGVGNRRSFAASTVADGRAERRNGMDGAGIFSGTAGAALANALHHRLACLRLPAAHAACYRAPACCLRLHHRSSICLLRLPATSAAFCPFTCLSRPARHRTCCARARIAGARAAAPRALA